MNHYRAQTPPHNPDPLHILVVGTGAVGGYYGAQLAKAGALVSTTHRSDWAAVAADGIRIEGMHGLYHFRPAQVLQQVADYGGFPDYILVALKVLEEISVAEIIRPVVGPATTILLLQNGVEIEQPVAKAFPDNPILSGLAFVCLSRTSPGHILHTCYGHLTIGRFPGGPSSAAQPLARLFEAAGTPCTVSENIALDRWKKLVWNAAFNPISVLAQSTTREILDHPPTAQLAQRLMEEVCQVAAAAGYPLPEETIQKNLDATHRMKPYKTSMLLDYQSGRPMEVEAILGNAIQTAKRHQIPVPALEMLYAPLSLLARRMTPSPTLHQITG